MFLMLFLFPVLLLNRTSTWFAQPFFHYSLRIWFETSELDLDVSKSSIWKRTTSGVFSFVIISQLRGPIELKFSQLFYASFEIHHVRRVVFDNYQRTVSSAFKQLYEIWPTLFGTGHKIVQWNCNCLIMFLLLSGGRGLMFNVCFKDVCNKTIFLYAGKLTDRGENK